MYFFQIRQYSKYNEPSRVVRDENSPAQALCTEELYSDYIRKNDIILFLAATTLLPIITTAIFLEIMWRYKNEIDNIITTPAYRPQLTGIFLTGALVTIYIFCLDISSVHFFKTKSHEYSNNIINGTNLESLHWTHVTLTTEILLSGLAAHFTYGFLFIKSSSLANGLRNIELNIVEELDRAKVSFIAVPIIFVSTHINYILAAWLTEPSKTTSVATLAIALILLLYFMNKLLYSYARTVVELLAVRVEKEDISRNCYKCCCSCLKNDLGIEIGTLFITISGAILGAGMISIEIAAFYILPFSALNLAGYLQNILSVSVLIVSALITYKIIDKDSNTAKKIINQDNKEDPKDSSKAKKIADKDNKKDRGSLEKSLTQLNVTLEAEVTLIDKTIQLTEPTLKLKLPSDSEDMYIPVFKAKMCLHGCMSQKSTYISLANAEVEVYLHDNGKKFIVSLKGGHLNINQIKKYELSEKIIQLIHGEPGSDLQAGLISSIPKLEEEDVDIDSKTTMTISATSTCYLSKFCEVNFDEEACCHKFNSITTINSGEVVQHILLPDNPKMKLCEESNEYYFQIAGIKCPLNKSSNALSIKTGKQNHFKLNTKNVKISLNEDGNNGKLFRIVCLSHGSASPSPSAAPTDGSTASQNSSTASTDGSTASQSSSGDFELKLILGNTVPLQRKIMVTGNEEVPTDFEYIWLQATDSRQIKVLNPDRNILGTINLPAHSITIKGCENPQFLFTSQKVSATYKEESLTMKFGDTEPSVTYSVIWNTSTQIDLPLSIENKYEDRGYLHFPNSFQNRK